MKRHLDGFTSVERSSELYHHIDAGFINVRLCFNVLGTECTRYYEEKALDPSDFNKRRFNDRMLTDFVLKTCRSRGVTPLSDVLTDPQAGQLFCSTEDLAGSRDVYKKPRVRNRVRLPYPYDKKVYLEFGTEHFVAATGKTEQSKRYTVSIIGVIRSVAATEIIAYPVIMGAPWLEHHFNEKTGIDMNALMWAGYQFFELYPEDISEFAAIKGMDDPPVEEWTAYMKELSEDAVKQKLCELLQDPPQKDWGGEEFDHFTTSLHLGGTRRSAAFVLKGPANGTKFKEMTPAMLGKNGDQICRLAKSSARLLIVQHCHTIGDAVRTTLRHFAVAPHDPRHYCLIDGKDTYKILKAYDKL